MGRVLVAACLLALASAPSFAKDRRPGHADPETTWDKQAAQTECGRVATTTDSQAAKGKHGQIASTEATTPCTGGGGPAAPLSGKSGRNDPGRN